MPMQANKMMVWQVSSPGRVAVGRDGGRPRGLCTTLEGGMPPLGWRSPIAPHCTSILTYCYLSVHPDAPPATC